ncbi:hypothetical protein FRC09_016361 [Ceratobasidium sp. 395]|nr:hypothetical protein FRC09_016361 [Ceratobasidium sp. 395]
MSVMSVPRPVLPESGDNVGIFLIRGPQTGFPTGFTLSPDGNSIFSSTLDDLVLVDTRTGRPMLWILTGPDSKITAIDWLNPKKCFLGCDNGHIYITTVGEHTLSTNPVASISYSFQDIQKPIKALRWDATDKLLAICYEDGVSIWKSTGKKWKICDRICIPRPSPYKDGLTTIIFYGTSKRCLFIGGGFGHATWAGVGDVTYFRASGLVASGITAAAVSPNGDYLVATSFNGLVKAWPVIGTSLGPEHSRRTIITGQEYRNIHPYLPVGVTSDGLVAVGTQVGVVELGEMDGSVDDTFTFENNWSVMGLLAHEDRVYTQYMGSVGAVIIVGWVNNEQAYNAYKTLNNQIADEPLDFTGIRIDINQIPKGTLAGSPMQTGRTGFDLPANMTTPTVSVSTSTGPGAKVVKESNMSSKRAKLKVPDDSDMRGPLSSGFRFLILILTLGCAIAAAFIITSDWVLRRILGVLIYILRAADGLAEQLEGHEFN